MEPLILGPSGRPVYTEHEVEVITCTEVTVEGPEGMSGQFLVRLTNFRFLFQDMRILASPIEMDGKSAAPPPHKMLHWSHIASTSVGKSFLWWKSTNLILHLYSAPKESTSVNTVTLTLSGHQFDKFVKDVQLQQERKSWVRTFNFAFLAY
jgi:hypothetical protein